MRGYVGTLYYLCNFSVNLKLFLKEKFTFFNVKASFNLFPKIKSFELKLFLFWDNQYSRPFSYENIKQVYIFCSNISEPTQMADIAEGEDEQSIWLGKLGIY